MENSNENTQNFQKEELERILKTKVFGRRCFWREKTESTNLWAREEGKKGAGAELHGALFVAGEQSAGQGRFGRVWKSPPGQNIYMTLFLWRPKIDPLRASQLTLVMGLSAAQAAGELTGKEAGIKWPNDVVMSGKKICGILTQMQMQKQLPEFIIVGVGININQDSFSEEICDKATSLSLEKGSKLNRTEVVARTLEYFEKNYELFLQTQDLSLLKRDYEAMLLNKDKQVRILEKQGESTGIARGITDQGELLVEEESGTVRKVFSGEVSVRGLYSYV